MKNFQSIQRNSKKLIKLEKLLKIVKEKETLLENRKQIHIKLKNREHSKRSLKKEALTMKTEKIVKNQKLIYLIGVQLDVCHY